MDLRGSIDRQNDVALGPFRVNNNSNLQRQASSPSSRWHNPTAYIARATKSGDTALHIAVNDGQEDTVRALLRRGISRCAVALLVKIHLWSGVRNHDSETPFFSAALHGKKDAFLLLHGICGVDKGRLYYRRKDGETILHVTISGEYFDLSFQIIHLYEELVYYVDHRGTSPLHLLASKPTAFRSGCHLGGYRKIIYNCTFVEELRAEEVSNAPQDQSSDQHVDSHCYPKSYETCCNFFWLLKKIVEVVTKLYKDPKHQTGDAENQQGELV
ncbi:hypothetical protein OIU78_012613 [Salix suchowensis]|nr:hypothetical protein OIU78_012613 [Salix suchowensis]